MIRKRDLPFEVGQEVEAKFTETGYRGAWFRCKILEIKTTTAEPALLLKYLDFPDEANSWAPVRQSFPTTKLEAWRRDKKSFWMVRPKPAIIHKSEVENYQEKIRMGQECSGYVHVYTHTYMVGDHVDWCVDDCYWSGRIITIESETNKVKLRFPPPPHGEGKTDTAPLESLRPSFSWTPKRQWRQMGLKKSEPRKGVQGYTSYKSPVQLMYFPEDAATPTVVSNDLCGPVSSRNAISGSESEVDGVAANSRSTPGEGRHSNSGSHELVVSSNGIHEESKCIRVPLQSTFDPGFGTKQLVYNRSVEEMVKQKHQLRNESFKSVGRSSIEEAPEVVKRKKFKKFKKFKKSKRKVLCNPSFIVSDSDEECQRSSSPRSHLAADGARSSKSDSDMGTEHELVNPPNTHSVRLDASSIQSLLLASSPTEGEMNSSADLAIADELTGELENIGSCVEFNTTPEHLRSGVAVGFDNKIATASEDLSPEEFVISDATVENTVRTHCTLSNACDQLSDTLSEAADIDTVLCWSAGTTDSPCSGATELRPVSSGTQTAVENPERGDDPEDGGSEAIGKEGFKQKFDGSDVGIATMCSVGADLKHCEDAGLLSLVCTIPEDNYDAFRDLQQQQATGSPTEDVSVPRSGQMKLSSHRSCVAIKKAFSVGRSRKRRRETDQLVTNSKWVRQNETKQRVDLSGFQTGGFMQEPLSGTAPSTPTNNEKRLPVMECIVKPEPVTFEPEIRTLEMDDSIHKPLWVLALPRMQKGNFVAVENPRPSTTSNSTEHRRRPPTVESGLEDELDALERLTARVHVLGAQLQRHKMQTRNKVVWKLGDKNMFFSGEGSIVDAEANDVRDPSYSWDCLDLKHLPGRYQQGESAKARDEEASAPNSDPDHVPGNLQIVSTKATIAVQEDANMRPFSRNINVARGSKSRSRLKVTKRGEKSRVSVRNLVTDSALGLRQPEAANQLLLSGSGNVSSKFNCGLKRNLADIMGPKKDCKKMRVDASPAFVEAVQKTATPFAEVNLPRMRGSVTNLKKKPEGSKKSKSLQKRDKLLDEIVDREEMLSSVDFEQEQQLEALHCGHAEQKSVGNSSLSGLPTKPHLSNGSNHDVSPEKIGSEALEGESNKRQQWHQVRGNSDSEILDNGSEENKVKLQPNGKFWSIKTHTVDGKLEWIGSFTTKETALSFYYVLNVSSCHRVKEVPPLSPSNFSCLREGADGDSLSPERLVNEKQVKRSNLERNIECKAFESCSTAVEPNAGSAGSIVEEANGMAADISELEKTSGVDEQKDEDQDAGAPANDSKPVQAYEQESSVIFAKEGTSVEMRVEADPGFSMEGTTQESRNTQGEETAHNPTAGPLVSSCKGKVVNVDRGIQSAGTVQDKYPVKVEDSESQVVAAADNPHESWIHDAVKCQSGRDALDRVSVDVFATAKEMEAARQAKMALWRGICCSPQVTGWISQGLDLFKRIQLWQSRMHFQDVIDGDAIKALLGTGKSREEIYLGHYKTAKEVDAVRKVLHRCKKEFAKSIGLFEASATQLVTSSVLQFQASTDVVQACAETVQVSAEVVQSIPEGGQASAEVVQSIPEAGQASAEAVQASAALVVDHLPSLCERQAHGNSRMVDVPPGSASVQNVIILEDDDENEIDATPISSMPPSSANARAFTGAIPVGTINTSIPPNSSQREDSLRIPASRTHGQSNGVISSFSRHIQERCHVAGVTSAGQNCVWQSVPISVQAGDTVIQNVGQGSEIYWRSLTQPPRQEWSAVVQGQQVNRYGGTVRANIVNSFERQAEIPSSDMHAFQRSVRFPTTHVPENHLREVDVCSSLPTTFNSSTAAALTCNKGRRFYNCCPSIGPCDEDFMLFKALRCRACNQMMHTECALATGQLRLRRNRTGQELACYECACGRPWGIVPIILSRMKEFIQEIWRHQAERLNQDPYLARPVRVVDLRKGQELCVIMGVLHKILLGAKTGPMVTISGYIANMGRAILTDANRVDYLQWLSFINNALICLGA